MPSGDIMPWKRPLGGTYEVRTVGLTPGQTYLRGHPVAVVTAGTLTQAPNDVSQWLVDDVGAGTDASASLIGLACHCVGGEEGE